jgi:hypothetical protein
MLKIHGERVDNYDRPDGTEGTRIIGYIEPYRTLPGHIMLNPAAPPLAPKLEKELTKLRSIDFGENFRARLDEMNDDQRRRAANSLAKPIATAKETFSEAEECRQFLSAVSITTLNSWGSDKKILSGRISNLRREVYWWGIRATALFACRLQNSPLQSSATFRKSGARGISDQHG